MTRVPYPPRVPRLAERILSVLLPTDDREAFLGDLAEEFARLESARGLQAARRWYWRQVFTAPLSLFVPRPRTAHPPTIPNHSMLSSLAGDIRTAMRGFARRPGFTAVFVLTSALGIGATTAIFSAANPILFNRLPYPDGNRVVVVQETSDGSPDIRIGFNTVADIRERNATLGPIAIIATWQATITAGSEAAQFKGLRVSPEYLTVLGVKPALGRDFTAADDVPNSPRTLILSNRMWRERFNADPSVIEREVRVNDYPYTVIGVMPADFEDVMEPEAEFWRPLQYSRTTSSSCRQCHHLRAITRLRDGVALAAATEDLNRIMISLGREYAAEYPQRIGGRAAPLGEVLTSGVRPAMTAALVAVLLVLLIACANATNLLLGRMAERRGEIAVRTALGAPRGRLVRQLLVESMMLATAGGVLGVFLAWAGVKGMVALAPRMLPRLAAIQVDVPVLIAALVVTTIVGLGFGLLPALDATRSADEGLRQASRRTVGALGRLRAALVVSEMALAVLVLTGSGLLLRSMHRVLEVEPGFQASGLLTLQLNVVGQRFNEDSVMRQYYDAVVNAVRRVPGVESVAYTSQLPLSDDYDQAGFHSERHPAARSSDDPSAHRYGVSPGYLETMGIPVVRGRTLDARDNGQSRDSVVLINAAFAARFFKGEDPVGQRIKINGMNTPWRTIVGITGDVRQLSLVGAVADAVYVPELQLAYVDSPISLVVRTTRDPASIASGVRAAVSGIDPSQPILRMSSMEEIVESSAGERRFVLTLFEVFAALSAVLAALGMYGVLAASVSERIREIGVREALGASPWQIVGLVVGQGMRLVGIGAAAGVVIAVFSSGLIADQLFNTSRGDVVTWAGVFVTLGFVAAAACAVPAMRAARVDPMVSLRSE
jgi:putative ABC transport system permease protein